MTIFRSPWTVLFITRKKNVAHLAAGIVTDRVTRTEYNLNCKCLRCKTTLWNFLFISSEFISICIISFLQAAEGRLALQQQHALLLKNKTGFLVTWNSLWSKFVTFVLLFVIRESGATQPPSWGSFHWEWSGCSVKYVTCLISTDQKKYYSFYNKIIWRLCIIRIMY
jgi:hypothetical protein